MKEQLLLSPELVGRIERSNCLEHLDKCQSMQAREGNPMGIVIEHFGSATAVGSAVLGGATNRVMCFGDHEEGRLDEIIRFFAEHNLPFRFEICPGDVSADLLAKLADRGFEQNGFHAVMYGAPQTAPPVLPTELTIDQVAEQQFDLYGDLYVQSFGMPDWTKAGVAENNRLLSQRPGRTFYFAAVDHAPAAVASLFVADQVANLALAGTAPDYRGKGCQLVLLHQRLFDASAQGCDLVVGQATFLSTSMRNMQRAGLQLAYTKAFFSKRSR
ncbi:hypothetical protein [Tumebacillus lipolyticus]|uniref:N-acetyltransferase domain-containing protein n=1 Tax=Tumebacillus lipolyticus TaxID=1280370 RepID=A0ABW4ZV75_9BACL